MERLDMISVNNNSNNRDDHIDQTAYNTELEKENRLLQRQINQFKLVHSIGKQISLTLELDTILTQIVGAAVGITNAEIGSLMLIDEYSNKLHLRAKKTDKETYVSTADELVKDELANEVINQKNPLRLSSEERILKVETGNIVKAVLYVPIKVDEKVIGVLSIYNETRARVFSGEDEQFLTNLAEYAGIAIRNSERLKNEQILRLQTEILRKAAIDIGTASNIEQLGEMLLDILSQVVEYKKASVQIIDGLDVNRRLIAFRGFSKDEIDPFLLRPVSQDRLAQRVFEEKKPLILTDPTNDPDWDSNRMQTRDVKSWIGLPLMHNQPLGLITLDHSKSGYYTDVLSGLLGVFCSQTAAVIKNLDLVKSEQEQRVLSDALSDTAIALNTALNLSEVLSIILRKVEQVVPHESANIMLIERGIAKVTMTNGYQELEENVISNLKVKVSDYATFTLMCQTCRPLLIPNVEEYPNWKDLPGMPSIRSYLGAPICIENEVIGFLNLNSNQQDFFSEIHIERLQAFIHQIAVSIKKSQLLESSQQQAIHMEIINETLGILNNKLNVNDLLQSVVDQVATKLNCTHCTLFEYNQETGKLEPTVVSGHAVDRSFAPGEGIVGLVFQTGESLVLNNASKDPNFAPARTNIGAPRSMIVSPVKIGKRTIGVICADQDEYEWFNDAGKKLVDMLGQQSGIAIERAKGLDLLHKITNEMVSVAERNDVPKHIVSGAIKLTNTSTGIIYLLNIDESKEAYKIEGSFKYPSNFIHPIPRMGNENGLTRTIIRERKCIVVPDIPNPPASHPNLSINPDLKEHYSSMLGMPLIYAGNVIGVLFVHDEKSHEFTEIQISLLSTLAQLAAIAIRNAQLFDDMQRQNHRLDVLNKIGQNISTKTLLNSIDLSDIRNYLLTFVYEQTNSLMDFSNFYIAFWDEQSEHVSFEFVREYGKPVDFNDKEWASRDHGNYLTEYVARRKEPLLIQNNIENWLTKNRVTSIGTRSESWLGAPMIAGTKIIGVIAVQNYKKENAFDDQLCEILLSIASQTAIAIENARLYIEVQANNRMLGLLQQASNMLIGDQEKNIRDILQVFLTETCQATNARFLAIVLMNDQGQIEDVVRSSIETSTDNIQPRSNGHSIQIWRTRESQVIPDTDKFEGDISLHPLNNTFSVRSVLGIPWIANDEVIGVVWLYYDDPRKFSIFEEKSIRAHFDQAAFIYQNSIRIKEQYRHRESMFTTLAHEIGIPLVGLASTANALKKEVSESDNKRIIQMANKLIEQSQKLELQTETILAMFGRQNKPVFFNQHSIYLPIIKAYELFYSTALYKGCEIKPPYNLNGDFPSIEMSEHHLTLAFQNLISNAIKYSYSVKAGINAERYISISGDWNDKNRTKYTISIQNYGVGIAPDEISSKRIFQPFERGIYSGDRGRPGKGLGLALVWHVVVVMHNGSIDVVSKEVPGGAYLTTFFVTLPLKQPESKLLTNVA